MPDIIDDFRGEYAFLSNFYEAKVEYEGIYYNNNESAFQAQKEQNVIVRYFYSNACPTTAKRMGRKCQLRADWEQIKDEIMYNIVKAKFSQNKALKEKLIATGNATLIEGNWWKDTYWGVCNGKGQNKLGKILMRVREELKN